MQIDYIDEIQKVAVAFIVGALVGIEREYRSKPAGFRTMIMICVGSCLFTILSKEIGESSPDRIASNIVTGIGFIGAGVIFKEGMNINGLTTAALIWVTAALGMAAGHGNYVMVGIVSVVVLFTLFVLEWLQNVAEKIHDVSVYKIKFNYNEYTKEKLETFFDSIPVKYTLLTIMKEDEQVAITYRIILNAKKYRKLNEFFMTSAVIKSFTV